MGAARASRVRAGRGSRVLARSALIRISLRRTSPPGRRRRRRRTPAPAAAAGATSRRPGTRARRTPGRSPDRSGRTRRCRPGRPAELHRAARRDLGLRPAPRSQFGLRPGQQPAHRQGRSQRPFGHRGGVESGHVRQRDPGCPPAPARREIGHRRWAAARRPASAARVAPRHQGRSGRAASQPG